jgi:hypothetical protein
MEQVATNGLKKSRKMPRSSIADFCNKIGTKRTIQLCLRLSAFGPERTTVNFGS